MKTVAYQMSSETNNMACAKTVAIIPLDESIYSKITITEEEYINSLRGRQLKIEIETYEKLDYMYPLDEELEYFKVSKAYEQIKLSDFKKKMREAKKSLSI